MFVLRVFCGIVRAQGHIFCVPGNYPCPGTPSFAFFSVNCACKGRSFCVLLWKLYVHKDAAFARETILFLHRDEPFCVLPWKLGLKFDAVICVRHWKMCRQRDCTCPNENCACTGTHHFACVPGNFACIGTQFPVGPRTRNFEWTGNLFFARAPGNFARTGTHYFACVPGNCACTGTY
jgi:hypothetical protein